MPEKHGCTRKLVTLTKFHHEGTVASVALETNSSRKFQVTNGVKQGCVLAPTLFSILYQCYRVPLQMSGKGSTSKPGMMLTYTMAFNLAQFMAKTRTTKITEREMLLLDDNTLAAHSSEEMQILVDRFSQAAAQFSFKINIKQLSASINQIRTCQLHSQS